MDPYLSEKTPRFQTDNERDAIIERSVFNASVRLYTRLCFTDVTFSDYYQELFLHALEEKERFNKLPIDSLSKAVYWNCTFFYYDRLKKVFRARYLGKFERNVAAPDRFRGADLIARQKAAVLEYANRDNKKGYGNKETKTLEYVRLTLDNMRLCEVAAVCGVKLQRVYTALYKFTTRARVHFSTVDINEL